MPNSSIDSSLSSFIPPKAAIAWVFRGELFVQYPHKDPTQPPCIIREKATVMNLAKVLGIMVEYPAQDQPMLNHPATKTVRDAVVAKSKVDATEEQREAARATLRKMGLL